MPNQKPTARIQYIRALQNECKDIMHLANILYALSEHIIQMQIRLMVDIYIQSRHMWMMPWVIPHPRWVLTHYCIRHFFPAYLLITISQHQLAISDSKRITNKLENVMCMLIVFFHDALHLKCVYCVIVAVRGCNVMFYCA